MKVSTRRSGFSIMKSLIVLVKPLTFVMILGILPGVLGFLCAIFLTITGGYGIIKGLYTIGNISIPGNIVILDSLFSGNLFASLILMAVARGILHYGEQYCNHYIAFRILAIIRHKVFGVLRKLCPAKLEGKEKGNLIAIITGDIELLEVFCTYNITYSHCLYHLTYNGNIYRYAASSCRSYLTFWLSECRNRSSALERESQCRCRNEL